MTGEAGLAPTKENLYVLSLLRCEQTCFFQKKKNAQTKKQTQK